MSTHPNGPSEDGSAGTERRITYRVLAYVVGVHLFAAFLFLLFTIGDHAGS